MKRSGMTNTLRRMVGHLAFLAGMAACLTIGEPLALGVGLTWRNVVAMCSIPWLCGYGGYQIGWLNGQVSGWLKARDEYRPNANLERLERSDNTLRDFVGDSMTKEGL
jgi:hypothetical protein